MTLAPGTRVGPYEVTAPLGVGGMGEVYRAHDSRLNRDVAIKVVPAQLAHDAARMARFTREAQVLASMNHPRIAAIYGVEEGALVMELVEGPTLAEHMARGPLRTDEVLSLASQVAEALEYAHERGIIHRDLKPGNIKLTADGAVKVLDFGLAKALGEPGTDSASNVANSPTLSAHATETGVILGTAAYMAPEQARGLKVDRRADIWSFGVLVYEMATGQRLFDGATTGDVLAAVLRQEPAWESVPKRLQRLLRRCLEKDPRRRLRDIGDWHLLLDEQAKNDARPAIAPRRARWWRGASFVLLLATIALGWVAWRASVPTSRPLVRLLVDLGPDLVGQTLTSPPSGDLAAATISPGGGRLIFPVRTRDGGRQLATRLLEQDEAALLPGTDGASDPFYSPDGQWVAFFAANRLKKVPAAGGAVVTLCTVPGANDWQGGSWGDNGEIVVGIQFSGGLSRVASSGGTPVPLTQLQGRDVSHRWPQVLPGSRAVVFTSMPSLSGSPDGASVDVQSQGGERKTLVRGGYYGRYLPTGRRTGHLVYVSGGALFAAPFDPNRLELLATPVRIVEGVARDGGFSASATGTVVFPPSSLARQRWSVAWLDPNGTLTPMIATPGRYYTPRLSPDGHRLALAVDSGSGTDIYVYELQRGTLTRLTFDEQENAVPIWAPDGRHLVFRVSARANRGLRWIRADGAGGIMTLIGGDTLMVPYSFTPDARRLAYFALNQARWEIRTVPLDLTDPDRPKVGTPEVFLGSPFNEIAPELSPDGRWMAYVSDESGRSEVYVRPLAGPGGKSQISVDGGSFPIWVRGGRALAFTAGNRLLISDVTVTNDSVEATRPRPWSKTEVLSPGRSNFDMTADGTRAVVFPPPDAAGPGALRVTMLMNFFDELRRH